MLGRIERALLGEVVDAGGYVSSLSGNHGGGFSSGRAIDRLVEKGFLSTEYNPKFMAGGARNRTGWWITDAGCKVLADNL